MLTLNFDNTTEQALNALAKSEQRSIEQVLKDALEIYRDEEFRENYELNKLADDRLNGGKKLISIPLGNL